MRYNVWNPYRELDALRGLMEQVFEEAGTRDKAFTRCAFLPGNSARTYPLVNVSEDRDALHVEALAPGLDPAKIEVTVHQGQLRIAGEKSAIGGEVKPEAYHRNERAAGRFVRTFTLPAEVNADAVTAQYTNGVLRVTLPKAEQAKPKQITVMAA